MSAASLRPSGGWVGADRQRGDKSPLSSKGVLLAFGRGGQPGAGSRWLSGALPAPTVLAPVPGKTA